MENSKSLNTKAAAEYLNSIHGVPITHKGLEVMRHYGRGPRYRKVCRWVIYDRIDLDKFAQGQRFETIDSRNLRNEAI